MNIQQICYYKSTGVVDPRLCFYSFEIKLRAIFLSVPNSQGNKISRFITPKSIVIIDYRPIRSINIGDSTIGRN